jgi:tRNA A-37 threonylcarbamoyl transferase component Bud32
MGEPREDPERVARIVLAQKMAAPDTVDRVVRLIRERKLDLPLAELLLQLGHITPEQFDRLTSLAKSAGEESREEQELFGRTVVERGLATAEQVQACLKDQAALVEKGVFKNLGELMVEKGILTAAQVKNLLEEQDQVIMFCPRCAERYNVLREWVGKAQCPIDKEGLARAGPGTGVGVAATLDVASQEADSPIGMDVGGCKIVELIGRGSMGAVYKARHLGLNRYVAIKMLPSLSHDPAVVKRFLFEARAVAKLEHPNIVQVYDIGFQTGYFFIVMQLLKGQTLEERLVEIGALPVPDALSIARDVAQGLGAAHEKGIIHRDIKPSNIVLTEAGQGRLADFGLAQDRENPEERPGLIVGTPYYMSPEQWLGHKADQRSDLYSLGIILYQMATGRRPFEGETVNDLMHQHLKVVARSPQAYDEGLSAGLCAMIKKMIAKAPNKRYPDVSEFLKDLRKVVHGEDPEAMAEYGPVVKCGFCETFNPTTEKKCKVCGEPLQAPKGPIELAARPDEFKCPGCRGLVVKGARSCPHCGKAFCVRCKQQFATERGHCPACLPHAPKK